MFGAIEKMCATINYEKLKEKVLKLELDNLELTRLLELSRSANISLLKDIKSGRANN